MQQVLAEDMAKRQAFADDLSAKIGPWDPEGKHKPLTKVHGTRGDELYKALAKQGRPIKQSFAKHADHQWLANLVTVHYVMSPKEMNNLLLHASHRDELSCIATLPGQWKRGVRAEAGLVVKGRITLLANDMDDANTGAGAAYRVADPDRTKMSGANKGVGSLYNPKEYAQGKAIFAFDKEDWQPRQLPFGLGQYNEALVDNWEPVGLILLDSEPEWEPSKWANRLKKIKLDIPIMRAREAAAKL